MIGPLFSQTAWNNVTFTGGETRDPGRVLPRALLFGCGSVVLLYLLANVAYIVSLPLEGIQHAAQDRVGTALMEKIFGGAGLFLMAGAILISTFGCDNGLILAGARVYYAMAEDGVFFKPMARLNRAYVPAIALVAQGVWASLLTLPRTVQTAADGTPRFANVYSQLLEYIVSADLAFYTLMVAAVVVMRFKRSGWERPYRVWGYPIPPLLYIVLAVLLLLDLIILAPLTSGLGFAIVLTGVPVYLGWHLWRKRRRPVA
jgi:APA family basic amino acid/polyamine antiporter